MNEDLLSCFCKCRCLASDISKSISNTNLTKEEKTILYDTLLKIQTASNEIQNFCENFQEEE